MVYSSLRCSYSEFRSEPDIIRIYNSYFIHRFQFSCRTQYLEGCVASEARSKVISSGEVKMFRVGSSATWCLRQFLERMFHVSCLRHDRLAARWLEAWVFHCATVARSGALVTRTDTATFTFPAGLLNLTRSILVVKLHNTQYCIDNPVQHRGTWPQQISHIK